jgi:membrane protein implicated in regulation of membrane protease activity
MEAFSEWWAALSLPLKVYWIVAIPATLLFVIQLILSFIGGEYGDGEAMGDSDSAIDSDSGIPFQFFTLKNLIAFFAIFGWTGIACLSYGLSLPLTVFISTMSGLLMMLLMATLFYLISKLTYDGTMKMKNAIGHSATVYLPIPAKRQGKGQVQVKFQGLQTLDAITDSEEPLETGQVVKVSDIVDGEILVVN